MQLEFDVEVVTPMFVGGSAGRAMSARETKREAEAYAEAEGFRVPELRGQMRYWFRAVAGHFLPSPEKLQAYESKIFGGIGKDPVRSPVTIRSWPVGDINVDWKSVRMCREDKSTERVAIMPGTRFKLLFRSENRQALDLALGSLWLVATLSGIGARTRRGFGGFEVMPSNPAALDLANELKLPFRWEAPDLSEGWRMYCQAPTELYLNRYVLPQMNAFDLAWQSLGCVFARFFGEQKSGATDFSRLNDVWLVWPRRAGSSDAQFGWNSWNEAMTSLREDLYHRFKTSLGDVENIGTPWPKDRKRKEADRRLLGTLGPRRYASPLLFHINRVHVEENQTRYVGLATVLNNAWSRDELPAERVGRQRPRQKTEQQQSPKINFLRYRFPGEEPKHVKLSKCWSAFLLSDSPELLATAISAKIQCRQIPVFPSEVKEASP